MNTRLSFIPAMVVAVLLLSGFAYATPGIPNQFWGTVTYNSQPAANGTNVTAKINNVEVASTTVSGGQYSLIIPDPNGNRVGKTIVFFVKGISTGQEGSFCNGCVTGLNLSVYENVVQPPANNPPSGGGGGGTVGGGTQPSAPQNNNAGPGSGQAVTTAANNAPKQCIEKWSCSEWKSCEGGVQRRTCKDLNSCGTNNNQPFESQPCEKAEREAQSSAPTGFFLTSHTTALAGLLLALLIAAGVLFRGKLFGK